MGNEVLDYLISEELYYGIERHAGKVELNAKSRVDNRPKPEVAQRVFPQTA